MPEIWNEFITPFRRQRTRRHDNGDCTEKRNTPADSAKRERFIQLKPDEEPFIVIDKVGLIDQCNFSTINTRNRARNGEDILTTKLMLATCTATDVIIITLSTVHPVSLSFFPPERMMIYATIPSDIRTTAKVIRNPTLRHIEQKYRSSP